MDSKINLDTLTTTSRARVYLLWAVLTGIGFTATHYYQVPAINLLWLVISVIGLGYMYKVMPLGVSQMKRIFLAWLVPIIIGLLFSVIAVRTQILPELVGYLGGFWLLVMAVGYLWNGLSDNSGLWYYVAAVVNLVAAVAIYSSDQLLVIQYLVAAIVSVWSMLMLWVFYSDL